MALTLSDGAQRTTLAFDGLAVMTGNLEAQSFFPPGKVADYTGFQYLRDNDPDNMGHNTSFLTRVANNVIYVLSDAQMAQLKALATAQMDQVSLYGLKRYPLMKAFRRLMDGDLPSGTSGLNLSAVKQASRELYRLDGQISFDRALLYAKIYDSMTAAQKAYLAAMKGKGWNSWPNITNDQINSKMMGMPQGTAVLVMTYASDIFSWYAGSLDADVYFCPERHGTYYGGFYIKDAPAVGHEGYSISEQLTATAGAALSDSSLGYVTAAQAAQISSLVDSQRNNLYVGATNIVQTRTQIATLLRSLLTSTASSEAVKAQVLMLSDIYGDLDGENNYAYATVFAQVYSAMSSAQKTKIAALRKSIMSGTYADGTAFDYSVSKTPFLYSEPIADASILQPYVANTDYLFAAVAPLVSSFTVTPSAITAGQAATLSWSVAGATSITIDNGVGTVSGLTSKSVSPTATTTYTLTASNGAGNASARATVTVAAAPAFSLSLAAATLSVAQGSSGTVKVTTAHTGAFNSAVTLTATGAAAGVTAAFSPGTIAAPGDGTSTVTVQAAPAAAPGTYQLTIQAAGGGQTQTKTLTVTVTTAPGFTLTASPVTLNVAKGSTGNVNLSVAALVGGFSSTVGLSVAGPSGGAVPAGLTAAFTPKTLAAPGSGSSVLSLTPGAAMAAGTYPLTVTATGGSVTRTATVSLIVASPPVITLSAAPASLSVLAGGTANLQIAARAEGGFQAPVTLARAGLPAGVTIAFQPAAINSNGGTGTVTVQASGAATAGTYPITLTGTAAGAAPASVTFTLNIGKLAVTSSGSALTIARGATGTLTVTTAVTGPYSGPVSLSATGLPPGVTATFTPASVAAPGSGTSVLKFTVSNAAATGTPTITIRVTTGGVTQTAAVRLTVT